MLRYSEYLEVWKLGDSVASSGEPGAVLGLAQDSVRLLELRTKHNEQIVCFGISNDAQWIGYSTESHLRFFRLSVVSIFFFNVAI